MPRSAVPVLALSITDVAMVTKRFDERQSCHVLQVLDVGVLGNAYQETLELQQTNACHGKWLLPDVRLWARYTTSLPWPGLMQAISKTVDVT